MKTCFKCGRLLPLDSFYRHAMMGDGHLGKCKACARADVHANRKANIERYRAYDTDRANEPKRVALRARLVKQERQLHPERQRARNKVRHAVLVGRLVRTPCEKCGAEKVEGHHDDYSKPLSVRWLCASHHRLADRGLL